MILGHDWKEFENLPFDREKVATILVAGGEGTRLGFDGPKGMFPIVGDKTLFEFFAEKVKGPVAIMLSPKNAEATRTFFADHDNFGIKQLDFFVQQTLPYTDEEGNSTGEEGPDGNGHALKLLVKSGITKKWKEQGIKYVTFGPVDNPLADPFDPYLLAAHQKLNSDVIVKAILRRDANEKVGLIVVKDEKVQVIEYSEVQEDNLEKYPYANLSLFSFALDFIERVAPVNLPIHKAFKKGHWKTERFIFDVLPYSKRTELVIYPRDICFAPVKNAAGEDSPETARKLLNMIES